VGGTRSDKAANRRHMEREEEPQEQRNIASLGCRGMGEGIGNVIRVPGKVNISRFCCETILLQNTTQVHSS